MNRLTCKIKIFAYEINIYFPVNTSVRISQNNIDIMVNKNTSWGLCLVAQNGAELRSAPTSTNSPYDGSSLIK